jgi:hypothetical protein
MSEELDNKRILDNLNIKDESKVLDHFLNLGNVSFFTGDFDLFEYFLKSLFEIADENKINEKKLLNHIFYLSNNCILTHNIFPFSIILNNVKNEITKSNDMSHINRYLKNLKKLALKSLTNNFDSGFIEIINVLNDLHEHFVNNNMDISGLFIKNILITLISSTLKHQRPNLKNEVISISYDVFPLGTSIAKSHPSLKPDVMKGRRISINRIS